MRLIKRFTIIELAILLMTGPLCAQKGPLIKPGMRPAAKTPAQLLEQTQTFIQTYGHRPRCVLQSNGQKLLLYQMDEQQQAEVRLGSAIQRAFIRAKDGEISPNDPNLLALRTLVEQYPNNTNFLSQKRPVDPLRTLQEAQAFIEREGVRPRSMIYAPGGYRKTHDEMNTQELEEVLLRYRITRVLTEKYPLIQQPVIEQLRLLTTSHSRLKNISATQLLSQLNVFIQTHHRLPKALYFYKSKPIATDDLTEAQRIEVHLARQIKNLLQQAKSHHQEDDPAIQALSRRWTSRRLPPMPTDLELLEELRIWVAAHRNRRPRLNIYHNGRAVPVRQMTPEEYQEYTLARRMEQKLKEGIADAQIREEMDAIRQLPTTHSRSNAAGTFGNEDPE